MNTSNLFRLSMILVAALTLAVTGCKKEEPIVDPPANGSSNIQQISTDDNQIQQIDDDINLDIEIMLTGGGNLKATYWLPCNATIDSTNIVNDSITYYITYHGLNCPETLYRTGKVEVKRKVSEHWYMPNAAVLVKIINLNITKVSTGKTIIINGVKTHRNMTGGLLVQLGYGIDHIIHRTHGFMTILFDDNTNRTWNIARRCVYTGMLEQFVITIDGFGQVGGYTNLVTWGVDRAGNQFYITIPEPVEHRQACNFHPIAGIQAIDIPSADMGATLTFGFDDNNQPVTFPPCPTKYKVDWHHNGNSGTIYLWL